jgi:hypothetical protein
MDGSPAGAATEFRGTALRAVVEVGTAVDDVGTGVDEVETAVVEVETAVIARCDVDLPLHAGRTEAASTTSVVATNERRSRRITRACLK